MQSPTFVSAADGAFDEMLERERYKARATVARREAELGVARALLNGAEAAVELLDAEISEASVRQAYDFGKMVRYDEERRWIVLSHGAVSRFKDDRDFIGVDDARYGIVNGHIGRLAADGQRFYQHSIAADSASVDKIADDFIRVCYQYADECLARDLRECAFRVGLSKIATNELQRRFFARGANDADGYLDYSALRAGFDVDRVALKVFLGAAFPEIAEDASWLEAAQETQEYIRDLFGKRAKFIRYSTGIPDRGLDPFYRVHAGDLRHFRALADNGGRLALVAGLIACVKLNAVRSSYRRKQKPALYDMAVEIADGGLAHPGQLVTLIKAYLADREGFALSVDADAVSLYRGLLALPAEILPGALREADYWGGAFSPWLRDLCLLSARAGEGPKRAAAWRMIAQIARETRMRLYSYAGREDFDGIREDALGFLTTFWRLLAREDRSGRKWADIRAEANIIQDGLWLFLPAHEAARGCQCQMGRSMPASSAWAGMVKSMEQALSRCYIERVERERRLAEARGGVQKWASAPAADSEFGEHIVREVNDSAGLRALGGVLHNCLGGLGWVDDCKQGLLRIYSVSLRSEGSPGGCFALRMKNGRAHVSETGLKGRGHTSVTAAGAQAVAEAVAMRLNEEAGFPCADAA